MRRKSSNSSRKVKDMTLKERRLMFNRIYNTYSGEIYIHGVDCDEDDERGYTYISRKEITLPKKWFTFPTKWAIFVLLHEVGHVKTNTLWMPLYEKEVLATQWAADTAREIGFSINKAQRKAYQDYIWEKREEDFDRIGGIIPGREDLVVNW